MNEDSQCHRLASSNLYINSNLTRKHKGKMTAELAFIFYWFLGFIFKTMG